MSVSIGAHYGLGKHHAVRTAISMGDPSWGSLAKNALGIEGDVRHERVDFKPQDSTGVAHVGVLFRNSHPTVPVVIAGFNARLGASGVEDNALTHVLRQAGAESALIYHEEYAEGESRILGRQFGLYGTFWMEEGDFAPGMTSDQFFQVLLARGLEPCVRMEGDTIVIDVPPDPAYSKMYSKLTGNTAAHEAGVLSASLLERAHFNGILQAAKETLGLAPNKNVLYGSQSVTVREPIPLNAEGLQVRIPPPEVTKRGVIIKAFFTLPGEETPVAEATATLLVGIKPAVLQKMTAPRLSDVPAGLVLLDPVTVSSEQNIRWVKTAGDPNPIHHDSEAARELGQSNLIVPGMLGFNMAEAVAHQMVSGWDHRVSHTVDAAFAGMWLVEEEARFGVLPQEDGSLMVYGFKLVQCDGDALKGVNIIKMRVA